MNKIKSPKNLIKKLKREPESPESRRITDATVAEHREKILAGGRKFKYPFQYSKHRVLIGASSVLVLALLIFGAYLWFTLYKSQDTNDFSYSVTKFLPLPVANVDGENVPYSDYMRRVRSAIFYKQNQEKIDLTTEDGKRELNYLKRQELTRAERFAYANKIANDKNITISDDEINKELDKNLQTSNGVKMTQSDYEANVLKQYFGWSIAEYKSELKNRLLERKVSFAVDTQAKSKIDNIKQQLNNGTDFAALAESSSDDKISSGAGGGVSAERGDSDSNGIIAAARSLEPGSISDIIQGIDGYYIVKLGSKTDTLTNFSIIKVGLTQFDKDFSQLDKDGKIKEYIDIPINNNK